MLLLLRMHRWHAALHWLLRKQLLLLPLRRGVEGRGRRAHTDGAVPLLQLARRVPEGGGHTIRRRLLEGRRDGGRAAPRACPQSPVEHLLLLGRHRLLVRMRVSKRRRGPSRRGGLAEQRRWVAVGALRRRARAIIRRGHDKSAAGANLRLHRVGVE